ncbi:MAG: hypothetical protein SPLUMA2_SPLUMAMAG2_01783 [uncultured Sulfurimonas sp.]|nr:MAG: hypothetical protein SPLUMA2_SPLUMAMAG2_01783 [uncultured Sulfurimonas sp.]
MILINALGIQDSGGIRVLEKLLKECTIDSDNKYIIICNNNVNIQILFAKYVKNKTIIFEIIENNGFLYRLYYENIIFKKIVFEKKVKLIYNFSGTTQLLLATPQLLKIQNLLFYTKKIDSVYKEQGKLLLWIKEIALKRIIFNFMSNNSLYLEIQSSHVKKNMSDFITVDNKTFFIKSDINVEREEFLIPVKYNFRYKIKFLYIVGPHFEYTHKNFQDFTNVMLEINKLSIDFEINVTLSKEELEYSPLWEKSLNCKTNFLGYISDKKEMNKLFCNNTILISTSIIETLGLHVIEAIKKGVIPIAPSEEYSYSVYGENIITYDLFSTKSLFNSILSIINNKIDYKNNILMLQNDLINSEKNKYRSIVDIFQKVIDVQK